MVRMTLQEYADKTGMDIEVFLTLAKLNAVFEIPEDIFAQSFKLCIEQWEEVGVPNSIISLAIEYLNTAEFVFNEINP